MNEELIRQCAREAAGEFDWFDHDTAEETATKAIRLYHARAVAPLVEAVEALGATPEGFCFCSQERVGDDSKEHEVECADVRKALAPFRQEVK